MKSQVFRESGRGAFIAFFLILLGLSVGGLFVTKSAQQGEIIGLLMGSVIGLAFAGVGVAWILKIFTERIELTDRGLRMRSAPFGKLTFQCVWADVVSYEGKTDLRISRSYPGMKAYTLQTPTDYLTLSGYTSYFPALHSAVLSHLPSNARVNIPGTPAPGNDPIRPARSWNLMSVRRLGVEHVFLCLLGGILLYLGLGLDVTTINGVVPDALTNDAVRYGISTLGVILIVGSLFALMSGRQSSVRLTPEGVEQWNGHRRAVAIAWTEMKSVEALYRHRDVDPREADEAFEIRLGSRGSATYYAVIGSNGDAIPFSSNMEDCGGFLSLLRRVAPAHVIFGTDRL